MTSVSQCFTRRCPRASSSARFFEVVKQLAIEDHDNVPVLIGHRLLAIREADNAQPARGQRDARLKKEALFIRAAMNDGMRHFSDDFVRRAGDADAGEWI